MAYWELGEQTVVVMRRWCGVVIDAALSAYYGPKLRLTSGCGKYGVHTQVDLVVVALSAFLGPNFGPMLGYGTCGAQAQVA